jgi:hypothetical protein
MIKRCTTASLALLAMLIPFFAMVFLWSAGTIRDFTGEPPLAAAAIAMSFSCLIFGWLLGGNIQNKPFLRITVVFLLSWLAFLLTLSIANLTPLCIGRDNGDGTNSFSNCLVYTFIWSAFYSVSMAVPWAISAAITGWFLKTLFKPAATPG